MPIDVKKAHELVDAVLDLQALDDLRGRLQAMVEKAGPTVELDAEVYKSVSVIDAVRGSLVNLLKFEGLLADAADESQETD